LKTAVGLLDENVMVAVLPMTSSVMFPTLQGIPAVEI